MSDEVQVLLAAPPFNHPEADFIIRSSDGVDFRVIKLLLSLASTFFKDLFTLPKPQGTEIDETIDGLPVVRLTEDSRTIRILLSFCYPVVYMDQVSGTETLSDIAAVLEATKKYIMDAAHKIAVGRLVNPKFLEAEPLRVYVVACRYGLEAEAKLAAFHTLRRPVLEQKGFAELVLVDASILYQVLLYHKRCAKAAVKVASSSWCMTNKATFKFFDCPAAGHDSEGGNVLICSPSANRQHVKAHGWWLQYMKKTQIALAIEPSGETVSNLRITDEVFIAASKCTSCRERMVLQDLRTYIDSYAAEVDQRVSQISLDVRF